MALNITSIKQRHLKAQEPTSVDNNKRKFAFLSTETIPDYRPKDMIIEKSQKTTNNQTTKFQQLQQRFSHVAVNNKDIPLIKEINSIGDNILTENDVSGVYFASFESFLVCCEFCRPNFVLSNTECEIFPRFPIARF